MENTVTKNIRGNINDLVNSIKNAHKDYVNEVITPAEKRETIDVSSTIAEFRIMNKIKFTIAEVILELKKERVNSSVIERMNELFSERM